MLRLPHLPLRQPGEKLPDAVDNDHQLKPVQFPDNEKPKPIPPPPGASPASAQLVSDVRVFELGQKRIV